jgi:hypothetical protein
VIIVGLFKGSYAITSDDSGRSSCRKECMNQCLKSSDCLMGENMLLIYSGEMNMGCIRS